LDVRQTGVRVGHTLTWMSCLQTLGCKRAKTASQAAKLRDRCGARRPGLRNDLHSEPSVNFANPAVCVIKLGGEVAGRADALANVFRDVAVLVEGGWRCVVCHGGGPQTTLLGQQLGLEVRVVAGQRVTDEATLRTACQAIAGEVGCMVVAAAWANGVRGIGISAGVVHARRRPPVAVASEGGRVVDYGLVGDVSRLELGVIEACWSAGMTPILNPIGIAEHSDAPLLNINGDTVASAIAVALRVEHLFALTSVAGVLRDRDDPSSRIPRLSVAEAHAAIAAGSIGGGMIPKVEEAIAALAGARAVHILAPEPGALLDAATRPGSRGTVLVGPLAP
jgi:acetylglutamate kinase